MYVYRRKAGTTLSYYQYLQKPLEARIVYASGTSDKKKSHKPI